MTATQKVKKRDKVPGNSLIAKYRYLYNEKPTRDHTDYMALLDITRDQAYQLRWQLRRELGDAYQGPTQSVEAPKAVQEVTTTELAPSTYASDMDELRAMNDTPKRSRNVSEEEFEAAMGGVFPSATPKHVAEASSYQYPLPKDPWDSPFEEEAPRAPKTVSHQEIVTKPVFDINLSDVDAATVQSFLRLISDRPQGNHKYTLELKLIEH